MADEDDGEEFDEEADDLEDLWDSFAERWEKAFEQMGADEVAHIQQVQELKELSKEVEQVVEQSRVEFGERMQARMAGGDAAAHQNSKVTRAIIEAEHAHAAQEVAISGGANRLAAAANAFKDSDDTCRDIEDRIMQRRLEAEAKRKELKKKREAEAEARRRSREKAAPPPPAAGAHGASSSSSSKQQQQRRHASSSPPRPEAAARSKTFESAKSRTFESFAEYDAAWKAFEVRLKERGGSTDAKPWLGYADIPWPSGLPMVSGIAPQDTPAVCKKKLRAAMLRWHPDKWAKALAAVREPSRPEVLAKVQEVARKIIDEKQVHG